MKDDLLLRLTYRDVRNAGLFDPYINAAIAPVQSPFVFEANMLKQYHVKGLKFGKQFERVSRNDPVGSLPLAAAAFTSGAVPGWYHAVAVTDPCDTAGPNPDTELICGDKRHPDGAFLQLVDGGIYDNYGYRTAFEVFDALPEAPNVQRVLIQIDNTTNLPDRTAGKDDTPGLIGMLMAISFLHQDEVFRRTFVSSAKAHGIDAIVLDLFAAASAEPVDPQEYEDLRDLHCKAHGLTGAPFAECMKDPTRVPAEWKDSGLAAYRVGMLHKTGFEFDYDPHATNPKRDLGYGTLMWQVGRLTVRMKKDEISCKLFQKTNSGGVCPS
jgi:hypothetical protein